MSPDRKSLGKGLRALIPDISEGVGSVSQATQLLTEIEKESSEAGAAGGSENIVGYYLVDAQKIGTSPNQPRKAFNQETLDELAESIREKGIIQPLVVKRAAEGRYELIAGERRFRASQQVGLTEVPVVIKDVSDQEQLEVALIENIQREDLNPIEEAAAFQNLSIEFGLTQDQIAQKVGKDRVTISNAIRLLSLPRKILGYIAESKLSAGHARAILMLKEETVQLTLAEKIIKENLTVRQAERWASPSLKKRSASRKTKGFALANDPHLMEMEEALSKRFGTKVKIETTKVGGRIIIDFYSIDDFQKITEDLMGIAPLT